VFYRLFGLHPYGYHWVEFLLFFAATCLVFLLIRSLTSSFAAAALGTLFFAIHSVNVYVTYDFAFAPELLYASFYVGAGIAYIRGGDSNRWYTTSICAFVLALLSKEAAITLAANIVVLHWIVYGRKSAWKLLPFFSIAAAYYLAIVRHFSVGAAGYTLAFHRNISFELREAFLWAVDFAGTPFQPVRTLPAWIWIPLAIGSTVLALYILISLASSRRKWVLFGLGWFVIGLSPMLAIVSGIGPYYLFLPLVGPALLFGLCGEWIYRSIRRYSAAVAMLALVIFISPFLAAAKINAVFDRGTNMALGGAGRLAERSLQDLRRSHISLPVGATIYIDNRENPDLWRYYGIRSLFQLAYADDTIDVIYGDQGIALTSLPLNDKLVVVQYNSGDLIDITQAAKANPQQFTRDAIQIECRSNSAAQVMFEISPPVVKAGHGSYGIRIAGAGDANAEFEYQLNDGPPTTLALQLNPDGTSHLFVSNETRRGDYRFIAFRLAGQHDWICSDVILRITD
jgi:hypothetical protein